jgi:hypothetical protein
MLLEFAKKGLIHGGGKGNLRISIKKAGENPRLLYKLLDLIHINLQTELALIKELLGRLGIPYFVRKIKNKHGNLIIEVQVKTPDGKELDIVGYRRGEALKKIIRKLFF